mmetsp:Transcript_902/g.1367  ORF Transcript_902/g.1367 Transcript_902/m.1367 type:complete len:176 (-) Transcript_902:407-934(-)
MLLSLVDGADYDTHLPENDYFLSGTITPPHKRRKDEQKNDAKSDPLKAASNACSPILSDMKKIEKELFQSPRQGSFAFEDLPHTRGEIDMRFAGCFPSGSAWGTTPVGTQLIDVLEGEGRDVLLMGKSGCGKTSAIFDAAVKDIFYSLQLRRSSPDRKRGSAKTREDMMHHLHSL